MPTVNKQIADDIIEGKYADDTPVHSIVKYRNQWGGESFGLNYSPRNSYTETEFVIAPELYWRNPADPFGSPDE